MGVECFPSMGEALWLNPHYYKNQTRKESQSTLATLNRAQAGDAVGEEGTGLSSTSCLFSECCYSICNLLNTLVEQLLLPSLPCAKGLGRQENV